MSRLLWTLKQNSGPAPRFGHAMAYDEVRGRTVLFGGDNRGSSLLGDTWEWDGNDWTQANDVGPGGRSGHAMAFSAPSVGATSFEVLLFGGQNGASTLADTWS